MENLANKVVLITGGASGVGRGMAEAFADAGACLVLVDIHEDRLKEVSDLLSSKTQVITRRVDIRDRAQIDALAEEVYTLYGMVNVLCNNAGVACNGLIWESSDDDWDWVFETNVRSIVHFLQAFVPKMLEQDAPGHIVNTSSMLGLSSAPLTGIYGASKQAVLGITESLRMDLAISGSDIGVSVLCPGPVRTNVKEEPGRSSAPQEAMTGVVAEIDATLKAVIDDGMAPRQVGDCVVEAVLEGGFWVLPEPSLISNADQRLEEIHTALGV